MKNFQELKVKSLDKINDLSNLSDQTDKVIEDKREMVRNILSRIIDEKTTFLPKEDYDKFKDDIHNFHNKVEDVLQDNMHNEQEVKSELNENFKVADKGKTSAQANLEQSIKSQQKMKNDGIKEKSNILIRENEEQAKKYAQLANVIHGKLKEYNQQFESKQQELDRLSTQESEEMTKVRTFKENAQILALASGSVLSPESRGKFIESKTSPSLTDTKDQLYNCAGSYDEKGNVFLGESYYNRTNESTTRGKVDENGIVYRSEKSTLSGQYYHTNRIGRIDKETGQIFIGKDRFSEQCIATFRDEKIHTYKDSMKKSNNWGKVIN